MKQKFIWIKSVAILFAILISFGCGGGGGGGDVPPTTAPTISSLTAFKIVNGVPIETLSFDIGDMSNIEITASDPDLDMNTVFISQFLLPELDSPFFPTSEQILPSQSDPNMKYFFIDPIEIVGPAGNWRMCIWIVDKAGNESNQFCINAVVEPPPQPPVVETTTVLAANDLGMHCMDREFSVFSILPPFNVVNAQVLLRDGNGRPYVADDAEVDVFYQATADASGSINTYSIGKTDFWTYADELFGVTLPEGQGLTGLYMPADDPQVRGSQPMEYSLDKEMFSAEGIPITPTDDTLINRPYPLLRISAVDAQSGQTLGNLDVVVPVATETDCQNCHRTGAMAAEGAGWSTDPDLEIQSKINILRLHDAEHPPPGSIPAGFMCPVPLFSGAGSGRNRTGW